MHKITQETGALMMDAFTAHTADSVYHEYGEYTIVHNGTVTEWGYDEPEEDQ